jgi:hypothetical protein
MQKLDVERFNLKKLNCVKIKEQYQIKILSRFAALEYLNDNVGNNRAFGKVTN